MRRGSGESDSPHYAIVRIQKGRDRPLHVAVRQPGECADKSARELDRLAGDVEDDVEAATDSALQRDVRRGEDLAGFAPRELVNARFPAMGAGDAQSVEMRVDALVQVGEAVEVLVRRADRLVAQDPEERRLLGVLVDDLGQDGAGHR